MLIIADSSALIALATCEGLDLLIKIFEELKVPQAVYNEVIEPGKSQASLLEKYLNDRVEIIDTSEFIVTVGGIGQGELESMALYKKLSADKLLIDDRRARVIAEFNNIQCIGSLGILLLAKHKGVIHKVAPYIEKLRISSIHFGEDLLKKVIQLAGE
ncbi:MAG: DUF3368 domain-containing protein [Anaerolineaceae bacterium]|nr:DUF3368 domain-containing protein [Anaerolineaceae bacterium]